MPWLQGRSVGLKIILTFVFIKQQKHPQTKLRLQVSSVPHKQQGRITCVTALFWRYSPTLWSGTLRHKIHTRTMPLRVLESCSVNTENLNLRLMAASIFTANLTVGLLLRKELVLILTTTNCTELYSVVISSEKQLVVKCIDTCY